MRTHTYTWRVATAWSGHSIIIITNQIIRLFMAWFLREVRFLKVTQCTHLKTILACDMH